MATGNFDHLTNGQDISPLFNQRLSYLKVVDCVRELRDYTQNMLLNEMAKQISFLRCSSRFAGN